MDFRYFIYVSVGIHVLGGLVLFFHYNNPFQFEPKPIEKVQELTDSETEAFQEIKKVSSLKKDHFKKSIPKSSPKKKVKPLIVKKLNPSQKEVKPLIVKKLNPSAKKKLKPLIVEKAKPSSLEDSPEQKTEKKPSLPSQDVTQLTKLPLAKKKNGINSSKFKPFSLMKLRQKGQALEYPLSARRAKQQGTVSVIYFVTNDGFVEKLQLQSSSGHRELDNFVLRSLSRYEFVANQSSWVRHRVEFILEGEEEEVLKLRSF